MSVGADRGRVRPGWKWFWFRFRESVESESVWKFGPTLFLLGLCVIMRHNESRHVPAVPQEDVDSVQVVSLHGASYCMEAL